MHYTIYTVYLYTACLSIQFRLVGIVLEWTQWPARCGTWPEFVRLNCC